MIIWNHCSFRMSAMIWNSKVQQGDSPETFGTRILPLPIARAEQ